MDLFECTGYTKRIIEHPVISTKYQEFTTKEHKKHQLGPQNHKPSIFDTIQRDIA